MIEGLDQDAPPRLQLGAAGQHVRPFLPGLVDDEEHLPDGAAVMFRGVATPIGRVPLLDAQGEVTYA